MNDKSISEERRWFEVCKYDFCVFFMNVCRRQVGMALDEWAREGARIWHQGGAIRMVRQNRMMAWRELRTLDAQKTLRWTTRGGTGAVVRQPTAGGDTVSVKIPTVR